MILIMLTYIRLVSYSIVIITSLRGIATKNFSTLLFIGNIVLAFILIMMGVAFRLCGIFPGVFDDVLLTFGSAVWAIIHFKAFLEE